MQYLVHDYLINNYETGKCFRNQDSVLDNRTIWLARMQTVFFAKAYFILSEYRVGLVFAQCYHRNESLIKGSSLNRIPRGMRRCLVADAANLAHALGCARRVSKHLDLPNQPCVLVMFRCLISSVEYLRTKHVTCD